MLSGRTFAAKRLPLTIAFTVLLVASFGAGCTGFFPKNTLNSIAIQPPTPTVTVGTPQTLLAYGTYSDNSRSLITSGVAWTSSDPTIISIVENTGVATAVTGGTATITASAQGISATATATAVFGTITNFQVCLGTFGATTSCSNGSTALTWNVASGNSASFISQGVSNSTTFDLTTSSTWGAVTPTPAAGGISCSNSGTSPETCTVDSGTTVQSYTFTVTYGSTGTTATVIVNVTS